jgi:hypothetical protein
MGHPVDDAIAAAGGILADQWKKGANPNQPENNLNPDTSALQFRIKLLEDKYATLENVIVQQLVPAIKQLKATQR